MLPASENAMVIVVITSTNVIGDACRVIMIDRATLVFGVEIFQYNALYPSTLLERQLSAQHDVFQVI